MLALYQPISHLHINFLSVAKNCCLEGGKMLGQHDQETEDFFFLGHINMGDQLNRKIEKDIASRLENWFAV